MPAAAVGVERRDRDALSQELVAAKSGVERVSQTHQSIASRQTGGMASASREPETGHRCGPEVH